MCSQTGHAGCIHKAVTKWRWYVELFSIYFYAKCIIILTMFFFFNFLDKKCFKWRWITKKKIVSSGSNNSGQIRFYYLWPSKWCWRDCEYYHIHNHAFVLWWANFNFGFSKIITDFECLPFSCQRHCWLKGNIFPVFCVEPFLGVRKCA